MEETFNPGGRGGYLAGLLLFAGVVVLYTAYGGFRTGVVVPFWFGTPGNPGQQAERSTPAASATALWVWLTPLPLPFPSVEFRVGDEKRAILGWSRSACPLDHNPLVGPRQSILPRVWKTTGKSSSRRILLLRKETMDPPGLTFFD